MNFAVEVRVPISPTPDFFRRIHFMAASLRRLSASIGEFLLVVCVGGDNEPFDLNAALPWARHYRIVWRWADRTRFQRDSFWETSREIFRQPVQAPIVICADADVLFVDDFSELVRDLDLAPAVAGVIAHAPPFRDERFAEMWNDLCAGYEVAPPAFDYEHTGWGFMMSRPVLRYTPVYFNFGMVAAPAALMEIISAEIEAADNYVNSSLETFFRFQIALTLTILKHHLPVRALPLSYNFPNDPAFDARYPEELENVRIIHYLRCETIHRENDFATLESVRTLVRRTDLTGSNERFRACLAELYPVVVQEETEKPGRPA